MISPATRKLYAKPMIGSKHGFTQQEITEAAEFLREWREKKRIGQYQELTIFRFAGNKNIPLVRTDKH